MEAVQHIPIDDREAFKYHARGDAGEEQRPLAFVRDRLRGVLQPARSGVPVARGPSSMTGRPSSTRCGAICRMSRARGRARRWRDGLADRRGDRPPPDAGAAQRRSGDDAGDGAPGGAALRRHGTGASGRRHVLPLPHVAQPRPRRDAREADGGVAGPETEDGLTSLEERLEREEFQDRIEKFKAEIEAEIRRRLVADRGAEAMAKTLRKPLPEDVEFIRPRTATRCRC